MKTTSETQARDKHPFESFPTDSSTCRYCQQSASNPLHANVPQPVAAEREEWAVSGRFVSDCTETLAGMVGINQNGEFVAAAKDREYADQILRDHTAAALVPELFDVLVLVQQLLANQVACEQSLCGSCNKARQTVLETVDEAIAAARKAGL